MSSEIRREDQRTIGHGRSLRPPDGESKALGHPTTFDPEPRKGLCWASPSDRGTARVEEPTHPIRVFGASPAMTAPEQEVRDEIDRQLDQAGGIVSGRNRLGYRKSTPTPISLND